ncbi:MAG TPA: twin-arginine translocation signal domain-containing protein [Vicinamibacterales bacterium]
MITRRDWLKDVTAAGAAALVPLQPGPAIADGTIVDRTSTSGVFIPARGRAFQKFSFDFPEPSVAFHGYEFGFRVFSHENVYGLSRARMSVTAAAAGVDVACDEFVWAGDQQRAAGRLTAHLRAIGGGEEIECEVTAAIPDTSVKSIATIVRRVPRGRISAGGAPFFDPRDDEILLGYPFSGGDLFGPQGNGGLTTPFVVIQPAGGDAVVALSSRDARVRTKRFYLQPGEGGYRVELLCEAEAWKREPSESVNWRIARAATVGAAAESHYAHLERAFGIPRWSDRADVPDWLRRVQLVVTLHGMHYTGYVFNDYARMLAILKWMAIRIDPARVLVFLASWDGRYYWDYPRYQPAERMGGAAGFAALIKDARSTGFRMMPMFGANTANRNQPEYARVADAFTSKIDGDRLDLNWVDWDNDRHQEGWLSYMNLGADSWRSWLESRIADVIQRYDVDAYFLDIVGGWINDPRADMHEGTRRLVDNLRRRFPRVAAVGEMHYDALLAFIPLYHSFGQTLVTDVVQRHAKFFQHLSHPAPGRGSTGVHEAGFGRWNPQTLSLSDAAIPTLNIVDDTFARHREEMDAVIRRAKERS